MKLLYKSIAIAVFGLFSLNANAQVKKEVKQEVRKEVKIEESKGEKVLTITTDENGNVTEEIYKGEAADKKMAEMREGSSIETTTEDIKVEEVNGEKIVTVTKRTNDKETIEVLKGEATDAKLKETESSNKALGKPTPIKSSVKKVEVKKVEVKQKP